MARSQVLNLADNFKAVITTPAWRSKPSWMLVATKDRTINPDLERWYAEGGCSEPSQQPQGRGRRRQPLGLRLQAEGGCCRCERLIEEAASHAQSTASRVHAGIANGLIANSVDLITNHWVQLFGVANH
jgi:hypothetical protein